jgi:16S rRNA C1402 (ribose-2'-O) methylase RsmI
LVVQGWQAEDSGQPGAGGEDEVATELNLRQMLSDLKEDGVRAKDAVAAVAESTGLAKNRVYQAWVELGRESK